jgi:hypothetical protein
MEDDLKLTAHDGVAAGIVEITEEDERHFSGRYSDYGKKHFFERWPRNKSPRFWTDIEVHNSGLVTVAPNTETTLMPLTLFTTLYSVTINKGTISFGPKHESGIPYQQPLTRRNGIPRHNTALHRL